MPWLRHRYYSSLLVELSKHSSTCEELFLWSRIPSGDALVETFAVISLRMMDSMTIQEVLVLHSFGSGSNCCCNEIA